MPFNTRIKNKKDTLANWESNNPVLLDGEIIFIINTDGTIRSKIGDGTNTYSALPFLDDKINSLINELTDTKASKEYVADAIEAIPAETWTFTLNDGTTVTKEVVVK